MSKKAERADKIMADKDDSEELPLEPETKAVAEPRAELAPMAAPEPDPIEAPKGTKQGASGGKR